VSLSRRYADPLRRTWPIGVVPTPDAMSIKVVVPPIDAEVTASAGVVACTPKDPLPAEPGSHKGRSKAE